MTLIIFIRRLTGGGCTLPRQLFLIQFQSFFLFKQIRAILKNLVRKTITKSSYSCKLKMTGFKFLSYTEIYFITISLFLFFTFCGVVAFFLLFGHKILLTSLVICVSTLTYFIITLLQIIKVNNCYKSFKNVQNFLKLCL